MRKYYYLDEDNQAVGPVDYETLAAFHRQGIITSTTLVAPDDAKDSSSWVRYSMFLITERGAIAYTAANAPAPAWSLRKWVMALGIYGCLGAGMLMLFAMFGLVMLGEHLMNEDGEFAEERATEEIYCKSHVVAALTGNPEIRRMLGDEINLHEVPGEELKWQADEKAMDGFAEVSGTNGRGSVLFSIRTNPKTSRIEVTRLKLTFKGVSYDVRDNMRVVP
ncbi:hypothetical protein DB346_23770 [Verrucomicrobia bacterium LW23]|nr:hypothetical protein DB346_23770 [Verrucomicrobia bacterium LW23]